MSLYALFCNSEAVSAIMFLSSTLVILPLILPVTISVPPLPYWQSYLLCYAIVEYREMGILVVHLSIHRDERPES